MITRDIYINSKQVTPPIRIVYGTNNLPVQFCMKDVELASGNTAKFYSLAPSENRYEQTGTIDTSAGTITFTPVAGFFETGQNLLQCEITQGGKFLYSFAVDVLCAQNLLEDGTAAEAEAIKTYVERAEDAADSAEASAQAAQDVLDSIPADYSELSDTVDGLVDTTEDLSEKVLKAFPTGSASGAVASFPDGADNIPMKSVIAHIEPVQAGSGDPSPTNVRAISGWDTVTIPRTNKNMFDQSLFLEATGWTFDGEYYTGTAANLKNKFASLPNMNKPTGLPQITLSFDGYSEDGVNGLYFKFAYSDGTTENKAIINGTTEQHYVGTSNASKVLVRIYPHYSNNKTAHIKNFQIEVGSTATAYEPYTGTTYTFQLGQTVYGGMLNPLTGHGWIEGELVTYDGESGSTYLQNGSNVISVSNGSRFQTYQTPICDQFLGIAPGNSVALGAYQCRLNSQFNYINFKFPEDKTVDEWKAELAENPIHVYKKYAEPIEIQLTPVQISTLLGQNNIWADSGDISVTYRADPTLYVDGKITPIKAMVASEESGTTASQAYTAGQYFILDGAFCKALVNIASGATFTLGTNYSVTTIGAELYSALHS